MAQGGNDDIPKKYDYKMNFMMEPNDKTITIEIEDKVSAKKWKQIYTEEDLNCKDQIEEEFKKIQDAINNGESEIIHPQNDNDALVLQASKGQNSFNFELPQSM